VNATQDHGRLVEAGRRVDPAVVAHETGHTDRRHHDRLPAVLDGAQPHHGQLLAGLGLVEGGVVGLHGQSCAPPVTVSRTIAS
jgi:hypothetical protein